MRYSLMLLMAVFLMVGALNCDRQPQTLGSFDNIIVLCDENLYRHIEKELHDALARWIHPVLRKDYLTRYYLIKRVRASKEAKTLFSKNRMPGLGISCLVSWSPKMWKR